MRCSPALAVALLALVALAPTALGAINGSQAYEAQYPYMPEIDAPLFTMVSGEVEATMPAAQGSFGLFATGGAEIAGLTRACWIVVARQCIDSTSGQVRLIVQDGGSFGLSLPSGVETRLTAAHGLALFVDLEGEANLNSLELGKSLMAPLVDGHVSLEGIPPIADATTNDPSGQGAGALAPTDAATTIQVYNGNTLLATLRGKGDPVLFAGLPKMAPVSTDMAVLPFAGPADVARFERADEDDAKVGLGIPRINGLMGRLYAANEGAPTQSSPLDPNAFGPYEDAAAALFGGAVLRLPTAQATGNDLAFARVSRLEVHGTPGDGLAWTGRASFEIRDGHVAGAKDMAGFGVLQLPWWSWVLWLVALGVWITRLVRKPEKHHATWDRFKWVGWVASPLVFLFVFWLWDLEVRALLGMSLFSGHVGGQVLLFVAVLEIGTFLAASFAAMAPLRMLFRNGSLLLQQGTFMGLSGAAAGLLGFLFIVTYLRSYLDVVISQVLAGIA